MDIEERPYIEVADICRVSKFSEHTVRRHLEKLGIAEEIGGRLWIARHRLRARWESVYELIEAAEEEGIAARPPRPVRRPPVSKKKGDAGSRGGTGNDAGPCGPTPVQKAS